MGGFGWLPFFRRKTIALEGARFRILRHGGKRRYLHIHGNEPTARETLIAHLARHSGTAYLIESQDRNVPIGRGGKLDPNRMFSRAGAEKNLRLLNPAWSGEQIRAALDSLDRGRERLVRALLPPHGGLLLAVHNNAQGYSVRDEIASSDQVSLKDPEHPHEFFLCTQAGDFERLAASPYNVVLQHSTPPEEDGSLSRLAARRGARYVNLECAIGKRKEQAEMLEWAEMNLR